MAVVSLDISCHANPPANPLVLRTSPPSLRCSRGLCVGRLPGYRISCSAKEGSDDLSTTTSSKSTLGTLDSLLGSADLTGALTGKKSRGSRAKQQGDGSGSEGEGELVEWWKVKPRQAAPPRQKGMAPGTQGRFILNEDFLRLNELKVGRKTEIGAQLEVPKVQPIFSFVLLLVNLACYGTYANISVLQGSQAANDFLSGIVITSAYSIPPPSLPLLPPSISPLAPLSLVDSPPMDLSLFSHQLTHALTSTFMASGPMELGLTLWALAMVTPKAESVMGYFTFLSIYLLSGVSSSFIHSLLLDSQHLPVEGGCGASGAIMGVLAFSAVYSWRNGDIERQAAAISGQSASPDLPLPVQSTSSPEDSPSSLTQVSSSSQQQTPPFTPTPPSPTVPTVLSSSLQPDLQVLGTAAALLVLASSQFLSPPSFTALPLLPVATPSLLSTLQPPMPMSQVDLITSLPPSVAASYPESEGTLSEGMGVSDLNQEEEYMIGGQSQSRELGSRSMSSTSQSRSEDGSFSTGRLPFAVGESSVRVSDNRASDVSNTHISEASPIPSSPASSNWRLGGREQRSSYSIFSQQEEDVLVTGPSLPAVLAGGAAGTLLSLGMGPSFRVQRELHIPEGSMVIPDDAQEMVVVMDRTTEFQRAAVSGSYLAALLSIAAVLLSRI